MSLAEPLSQEEMLLDLSLILLGAWIQPVWELVSTYEGRGLWFNAAPANAPAARLVLGFQYDCPPVLLESREAELLLYGWLRARRWHGARSHDCYLLLPEDEHLLLEAFGDPHDGDCTSSLQSADGELVEKNRKKR